MSLVFQEHLYHSSFVLSNIPVSSIVSIHGRDYTLPIDISQSSQSQLILAATVLAVLTLLVAIDILIICPYPTLSYDIASSSSLYIHHCWIGSFLVATGCVHGSLYLIQDASITSNTLGRLLNSKGTVVSHIS